MTRGDDHKDYSYALQVIGEGWCPTGFYVCPLCGERESVHDFFSGCVMEQRTRFVRDRVKKAIAQYDPSLRTARRHATSGDAAAIRRLMRWDNTLTLYKRTLKQIEKSAEVLEKAVGVRAT